MATLGHTIGQPATRFAFALRVWGLLAAAALAAIAFALASGSSSIPLSEVWRSALGQETGEAAEIVWRLRLPRALAAFGTGALLALAGALMQVLLRNPLADPYVLGLSGGAATGALLAIAAGFATWAVSGAAAVGALSSTLLVVALARRELAAAVHSGPVEMSPRLLLTGVIIAAGWGAVITLILTLAPDARLRGMIFWLLGDLNGVEQFWPVLLASAVAVAVVLPYGRELNVLLRGEVIAQSLGVGVRRLTIGIFVVASLATAAAVTTAGTVGFVGLLVPHALRLAIGNDQRTLLPAAALAGGALLVLADTLARTIAAPIQLPVGMLMTLIGVPVFIGLMFHRRGPRT